MEQPKKSKSKVLYDAVSQSYDIGTFEEFEKKLQDPEKRKAFYNGIGNEFDLGSYSDFERKVLKKKEPSVSTSQPQKSASVPKTGTSDFLNTDPLNPVLLQDELKQKQAQPKKDNTSQPSEFKEGSYAWNQEKLRETNPDFDVLYNRYKEATTLPEERRAEIQQEVDDEINNVGFVNKARSFMAKTAAMAPSWLGGTSGKDIDPLYKEKELAVKELGSKASQEDINARAREIAINKRIKSEEETLSRDFLKEAENTVTGRSGANLRQQLLIREAGEFKSLEEKDKLNLAKQDVLRAKVDNSLAEVNKMNDRFNEITKQQGEVPQDFIEEYRSVYSNYQNVIQEALDAHNEYVNNTEKLGDAADNLDVFKRDYSWAKNFKNNIIATVNDMAAGSAGLVDYLSSANPAPNSQLLSLAARQDASESRKTAEDLREKVMKPIAVDDINSMNDFGSWIANTVVANQVPIYAMTAAGPGGVAAIGTTSTGQKFEEMQQEMASGDADYNTAQLYGIPLLYGATETASSAIDLAILRNAGRTIRSANAGERKLMADGFWNSLKEGASKITKETAKGATIEGLDEAGTQVAQNLIDRYAGDKDVNILDNVKDAGAAGAVMGAFIPFGSNVIAPMVKPFTTDSQLQNTSAEIEKLKQQLNNPELSENARNIIDRQLTAAENKQKSLLTKTVSDVSKMSNEDFQEVINIEKEQAKLKQAAQDIDRDNSIDIETKKLLKDNLKTEFDTTEQRRAAILEGNKNDTVNNIPDNSNIENDTTSNNDYTTVPEAAIPTVSNNQETITDETVQEGNTDADGNVQPGTQPVGEISGEAINENNPQDVQPTTDAGTGQGENKVASQPKRIKVPAVKNGEFDIEYNNDGGVSKITSVKDGREIPKFVERTNKKNGKKHIVKNANYSRIEAEATGTITENQANEERRSKVKSALDSFTPNDPYGAALDYVARGGNISLESAKRETGLNDGEVRWATGFKPDNSLPSIEAAAEQIASNSDGQFDEKDVRDALIEIISTKKGVNQVEDEIVSLQDEATARIQEEDLQTYLNSLNEADRAAYEALTAEDEYISELTDAEVAEYYNQIIEEYEQGRQATEREESGEPKTTDKRPKDTSASNERPQPKTKKEKVKKKKKPSDKKSDNEQASVQERNKSLVTERIKPQKKAPKASPKKLNQIIADAVKGLKATLIYGRSNRARSAGTYNPSSTLVRITRAGDIDTVAHELGHLLDDRFDVLGTIPEDTQITTDRQLKWFADRGGSNPPESLSADKKAKYIQREGLAEFIRAYIANPEQAKIAAPELYAHFENSIDAKTKDVLGKFSDDFIDYANATAGEQMLANVEELNAKEAKGFKKWIDRFKGEDETLNITPLDNINAKLLNSMGIANKAFRFLNNISEKKNLLPEENFELISRLFAGINGKTNRILSSGLVDSKNNVLKDSEGNSMNVKWLLEPLDNASEKAIKEDMDDVIRLLVAQRTLEYATKFGRLDNLTGVGGGVNSDTDVAQAYLDEFNELKKSNPDKYKRVKEAAKRYRQFADKGLRYAVEKGRISEEQYQQIKESNQYYVSLARVNENSPMEEDVPFFNEGGGNLTSVRDVIKKAKGGTKFIQNPYVSLLQNTVNIIKESDRNEVMQSFIEPLQKIREMGDGKAINFAQVARPAVTGDKNTKTIFVDGEAQRWQFAKDIYDSLTSLEAAAKSPLVDFLAKPADVIRFTVTNFPTFALRNAVRDTFSRLVISRTNSGFKDLVHNATDKELFELYGGSQAGYYLVNKDGYRQKMKESVAEITKNGGIVLDPRTAFRGYRKLLERGENLNRIAEFKAAYRKAKKQGLDDYNAGLYAAYQARDLMDFAVAGHTIRTLNRFIPFLNAGIQGLRRTGTAVKENPGGFAVRTALYTVLPTIAFRGLVTAMGDDDEYEQLPAYQRDLFWMFKTPFTGDTWIAIPKPFEQGTISSVVDRGISQAKGYDTAWEGFSGTLSKTMMPVEESSILGGLKPLIEANMNYNTFTDRNIVPAWEDGKLMELRKTEKASRVGQGLSDAFKEVGWETDPRKVDHVITGYGTYMADWGLSFGDLGVKDTRYKFGPSKTGFARDVPMNNSVSVNAVYKLATELGAWNNRGVKRLRGKIEAFYDEEDAAKRKTLSKEIYEDAKELRKKFEEKKKTIKEKATD